MTSHKQVKYKDFEVDEKILPLVKKLNENDIKTIYSCQGDETCRPYVVIKSSNKAEIFIKTLLMVDFVARNEKMKQTNDNKYFVSGFEVILDCQQGEYRYCIRSLNLKNMEDIFNATLDLINQA